MGIRVGISAMFAMIPSLIWGEKFCALDEREEKKKRKRTAAVLEKVAAFVGVLDSRSVNGGCCVLFRLWMNRRFVCQMTSRQWLQDGREERGVLAAALI
ncbi:hypothetical protein PBY51_023226 [Eleginops maclovinus]|uniref:Secreted protein n=1 Tax=Eleginops maclovinus TaxID=56733 RepID=A0AAN7WXZ0_ELEMC|nr:hypothetical protein PBY51_023226 [Eleginops maclovinus]